MRLILTITTALLLTACESLLSGTRVFQVDVVRDGQPTAPGQPIDLTPGTAVETQLPLADNDTYEKHRDEIKRVDRAGFEGSIVNTSGAAATFSMYFSLDPGLADPANEAIPLIREFVVPDQGLELTYAATEDAILNMESFQTAVRNADFSLYLVGDTGTIQVADLRLIVTFTVGL